jgi:hypothetical protein
MALYILCGLSLLFALRALLDWRKGILLMIVLAALQDPLRKLVPGTPGWLVLAIAPVFLAAIFASITRTRRWWASFGKEYRSVAIALLLLILFSLPSAMLSATYSSESWMLTVLGAFSYSIIFLAMIAGFHYPRRLAEMRKLLAVYCVVHGVMLTGGLIQYLGLFPDWPVLGTGALGFEWIRRHAGYTVDMISGFYRSSDVMGWHAATVCMLSLLLAVTGKGYRRRLWVLGTIFAAAALLLCGRRKMVYMLPVFLVALGWIYWQAGRSARMVALMGVMLIPIASVWLVGDLLSKDSENIRYYSEASDETLDRFETHGFNSLIVTYNQSGFFGEGLGTATPGSHNLDVERPRTWQESGSSRILVELGVPGAFGFLIVMAALVLSLWRTTLHQLRARTPQAHYAAGMLAFFLANVGSLTVSGQILADPFIAAFLGFLVGVTLSASKLPTSRTVPAQMDLPSVAHGQASDATAPIKQ